MSGITIVGAGFAGLTAIRTLRKLRPEMEITLVSPKKEFVYLPGLIWLPNRMREPEDLVLPLDRFLRRHNVQWKEASATGLSDDGRVLKTTAGELENEGLIIASGGRFIKKLSGIEHVIAPCEGVAAGLRIRAALESLKGGTIAVGFSGNPKEPTAMRGGPMFEFLFGINRQLQREKRRDKFKLVFFSPAPKPGNRLGAKAVTGILAEMKRCNVETYLGQKIKGFEADKVMLENNEFAADLILFMPGMTGNKWFANTPLPMSPGGLVAANDRCQVDGLERVYVAGDSGSFPGPDWMPKQAHMADLQAAAAAKNLCAELDGKVPQNRFKVELVCIIDAQQKGMFVSRSEKRSVVLPNMRVFHWAKRFFEWAYLRKYR